MGFADETYCGTDKRNTGLEGCAVVIKRAKLLIWAPKGTQIDVADRATATSTLKGLLLNANSNNRCYLLPSRIGEMVDNTTEPKKITFGYGMERIVQSGQPVYTFVLDTDDMRAAENMQKFNNSEKDYGLFIVDEDDKILGTKDITTATTMVPFDYTNCHCDTIRIDAGEGVKYGVMVSFSKPEQFNNGNLLVWSTGIDVDALPRMNTLVLSQKTAPDASRIVDVKVMVSNTNFAAGRYGDLLAVTGAWKGTDTSGASLTVSSVSKVLVGGEYVYRITYASSGYPSSAAHFYVDLADSAALAALTAPLEGFESESYLDVVAA